MDESVHGAFSAYLFVRDFETLGADAQERIQSRIEQFITALYGRIDAMLDVVYEIPEIRRDIQRFANYNFNRTLRNLGFAEVFEGDDIDFHASVKQEITNTEVTFDIFSMTGNSYFMMKHEEYSEAHKEKVATALQQRSNLVPKRNLRGA